MGSSLFSCKDYLDVNIDPNQSTISRIDLQLSSSQLQTAIGMGQRIYPTMNVWCQYYTGGPGVSLGDPDQHKLASSEGNEVFTRLYRSSGNLNYIINNNAAQTNYVAVAKIMRAYNFHVCADLFGDIPYSEALKGDIADGSILHPKYESAENVVYPGLIADLQDAIATIEAHDLSVSLPAADDLVYGANADHEAQLDQWGKFARTLLLKLYLRSEKYTEAAALADSHAPEDFITDNADNAAVAFPGGASGSNPFWNAAKSTSLGNFYIATTTVLDHLNGSLDPRIDAFFDKDGSGSHSGIHPGSIQLEPPGKSYSTPAGALKTNGGLIFNPQAPVILMSAWEGNLLLAEAEARKAAPDAAVVQAAYDAAVAANFEYLGLDAAAADAYLAGNGAISSNHIKSIAVQKWTCMNGLQPVESWIETRRFDGPESIFTTGGSAIFRVPTSNSLGGNTFPSILPYPENEESLNQSFIAQHPITAKVFWDN
jgi:hypothetical protein